MTHEARHWFERRLNLLGREYDVVRHGRPITVRFSSFDERGVRVQIRWTSTSWEIRSMPWEDFAELMRGARDR